MGDMNIPLVVLLIVNPIVIVGVIAQNAILPKAMMGVVALNHRLN